MESARPMTSNPGPMFAEEQGTSVAGLVGSIARGNERTYCDHCVLRQFPEIRGTMAGGNGRG